MTDAAASTITCDKKWGTDAYSLARCDVCEFSGNPFGVLRQAIEPLPVANISPAAPTHLTSQKWIKFVLRTAAAFLRCRIRRLWCVGGRDHRMAVTMSMQNR